MSLPSPELRRTRFDLRTLAEGDCFSYCHEKVRYIFGIAGFNEETKRPLVNITAENVDQQLKKPIVEKINQADLSGEFVGTIIWSSKEDEKGNVQNATEVCLDGVVLFPANLDSVIAIEMASEDLEAGPEQAFFLPPDTMPVFTHKTI